MPICTNKNGDVFAEFITVLEEEVLALGLLITHVLVIAKNAEGFLLVFNVWKKHWEVAGGILEPDETLRECALRELFEETNQIPNEIEFCGLMKFELKNGKTEYGGLYRANIVNERPFITNNEVDRILFWNGMDDIGYIDEIDQKLLSYY